MWDALRDHEVKLASPPASGLHKKRKIPHIGRVRIPLERILSGPPPPLSSAHYKPFGELDTYSMEFGRQRDCIFYITLNWALKIGCYQTVTWRV